MISNTIESKHYHLYFTEHKKNMLKTWEGIKLIVNINKRNNKTITCLNVDGIEEMDPFLISNHFSKFFSTFAQKTEGKIVKTNKHFSDILTKPLQSNFFLTPFASVRPIHKKVTPLIAINTIQYCSHLTLVN